MTSVPSDILQQNLDATIGGIKRRTARIQSDVSSYNYGQRVIINFPSQLIDLRRSYLTFFAQLTLNGGTFAGFSYPLSTLFSRLRVLMGSQVVVDIDNFDALSGLFKIVSSNQSVTGVNIDGTYTQATRRTESTTGRLYSVKLDVEFLERIVPVDRIRGGMRLELTVNQAASCLEYDGGIPVLTLNQVFYNFYTLDVSSEINQMIDSLIASGQYVIRGWAWNAFTGQTAAIASTSQQLPFKFRCIRGVLVGFRDNADVSDATVVTKFTDNWDQDGIQFSNLKIGASDVYPVEGYNMQFTQGYLLAQRDAMSFMNRWSNAHLRQLDTFSAASPALRFLQAFDTRQDSTSEAWGNGINTADGSTNQILNVTFAASPGALWWNVYACYQVDVLVAPSGSVTVSF